MPSLQIRINPFGRLGMANVHPRSVPLLQTVGHQRMSGLRHSNSREPGRPTHESTGPCPPPPPPPPSAARLSRPVDVAISVHSASCFRMCLLHGYPRHVRTAPARMSDARGGADVVSARAGADGEGGKAHLYGKRASASVVNIESAHFKQGAALCARRWSRRPEWALMPGVAPRPVSPQASGSSMAGSMQSGISPRDRRVRVQLRCRHGVMRRRVVHR